MMFRASGEQIAAQRSLRSDCYAGPFFVDAPNHALIRLVGFGSKGAIARTTDDELSGTSLDGC